MIPFRTFRGPLFAKPVTGQELFFTVSWGKSALSVWICPNSYSLVKWLQAKEDGIEDSHVKVKDNITVSLSYKLEKKNVPGTWLLPKGPKTLLHLVTQGDCDGSFILIPIIGFVFCPTGCPIMLWKCLDSCNDTPHLFLNQTMILVRFSYVGFGIILLQIVVNSFFAEKVDLFSKFFVPMFHWNITRFYTKFPT